MCHWRSAAHIYFWTFTQLFSTTHEIDTPRWNEYNWCNSTQHTQLMQLTHHTSCDVYNSRNWINSMKLAEFMQLTHQNSIKQQNSRNSRNYSTLATQKLAQLAQHNRINATYFISWIFHTANRPTSTTTQHLCFSFTYTFCIRQLNCADNWKTRNLDWRNWRWGSFEMQLI